MAINPIFIFSVSRSGSTLVQRVIAAHNGVATVSEPWVLLPYLYTLRSRGVTAEYEHELMVTAIEDFCRELPAEEEDYRAELRNFVLRLYEKAAGGEARYFLGKSPPYCLIAEEIMRLFPSGKFVFPWRNPLSIVASIIATWEPWHPTMFRSDLFIGLPRLVTAHGAQSARAYSVRFEDLVDGHEGRWRRLMEYLGITFEPEALNRFSQVELNGRMGDPTGVKLYSALRLSSSRKYGSCTKTSGKIKPHRVKPRPPTITNSRQRTRGRKVAAFATGSMHGSFRSPTGPSSASGSTIAEDLEVPSIYFAHDREPFARDAMLYAVSPFVELMEGEAPFSARVRFPTVGGVSCTGAVEPDASTLAAVVAEIAATEVTGRGQTRGDDRVTEAAMEDRKKTGYF
jgi:Sulfotransferase family